MQPKACIRRRHGFSGGDKGTTMTDTPVTGQPTLAALLHAITERWGERLMVQAGDDQASFREVEARSAAIARGLLASGVGKGEKVGILFGNGSDWMVAFYACVRIGAVAVLLSTFAKPRELAFTIRFGDVRTLVACGGYLGADYVQRLEEAFPDLAGQGAELVMASAPLLRHVWIDAETAPVWSSGRFADLARAPGAARYTPALLAAIEAEITPSDPALIIFTSGTTSDPKAVLHNHGAVARHGQTIASYMTFAPGDKGLTTMPLFWVGGLIMVMMGANCRGGAFLAPRSPSSGDMLRAIRDEGASTLQLWPSQMGGLMNHPDWKPEDLQRLRPTSAQQLALFGLATQEQTPNSLGMSESLGPHSKEFFDGRLPPGKVGSFGRAIAGVERKIVDPVSGETLPAGVEGELCIRGYSLMIGYYKKDRSESFDADGWFHTGDFCIIDADGYLFFNGRRNEMIKTAGANVAPREVELLLAAMPGVVEAAVLGLPDARLGEMVCAVVLPALGAILDEAALKAALKKELADYKVPKRIIVLSPDDVPRTDSEKVKKPVLAKLLAERLAAEG